MVKDKRLFRFIAVCICTYISWYLIYNLWLEPLGQLDFWLTKMVAQNTTESLNLLGINAVSQMHGLNQMIKHLDGKKILTISNACNGLVLYPLFIGFILAIPGTIKHMIGMIVGGCILIYIFNVVRAVLLCLIKVNAPQHLDFNHRYTFVIFIYGIIFTLWIFWVNNYAGISRAVKE